MRNILVVVSVILTLCGCSKTSLTPEGRAKNLIKEHIKEYLDNPKSYDPIGFSELLVVPDEDWVCMIHYFRAENNYGATVKFSYCYDFDSDITRVAAVNEITEDWINMMSAIKRLDEPGSMADKLLNELDKQGIL